MTALELATLRRTTTLIKSVTFDNGHGVEMLMDKQSCAEPQYRAHWLVFVDGMVLSFRNRAAAQRYYDDCTDVMD